MGRFVSAAPPALAGILARLADGGDLTQEEATAALDHIVEGRAGEVETAALLMGLRVKGETADEIAGLVRGMRSHAVRVEAGDPGSLLDVVGTGGDRLDTFNISTAAAIVAAGAGAKVAKHGNRAASSRCGSADVLEALGVRIDLGPAAVAECIDRVGIGFMMAPLYHPGAGKVAPVRRALGIRTVFNFLGPLSNPAGAGRLLVGVSSAEHLEILAEALARAGSTRCLLVHGADGMDEVSVTGPTAVIEVNEGVVGSPSTLDPEDLGIGRWEMKDLVGGDPSENASLLLDVLGGAPGARRDAVLANAGAALLVAGLADSLLDGTEAARRSIDSGEAARVLQGFVRVSNSFEGARS